MKKTPIYQRHVDLGAKMVPFAGFEMPIQYSSISEEHQAVRNGVGIFDVSHMGEFIIKGKEALDLVQCVSSNDASKLAIGQAQYSCLPNDKGGIVDDMIVYRLPEDDCNEGEQAFMLVVNASNIEKDWNWISAKNKFDTRLINISDHTGLLAIQGPKAVETLQALTEVDLSAISFYHFTKGNFAGIDNILISATGYTGSGGLEIYAAEDKLAEIWDKIMALPQEVNPIGLGARDTLRLEMGYCLYGNDIDESTSPLEAGLGWITKLKKKASFSSQEILKNQKAKGIRKKLVGFTLDDRRVPRKGYAIFNEEMQHIGTVSSGTQAPSLGHPIGMGYVNKAYAKPGTILYIQAGKKVMDAEVIKLPFYSV